MITKTDEISRGAASHFLKIPSGADVTDDAHWFSSSLSDSALKPPAGADLRPGAAQPLIANSDRLQGLVANAVNQNLALGQTLSPMQTLKAARALSAVQLDLQLNTKVIGKTSQAIEKLTNLS